MEGQNCTNLQLIPTPPKVCQKFLLAYFDSTITSQKMQLSWSHVYRVYSSEKKLSVHVTGFKL